jgi:hypothetical protein
MSSIQSADQLIDSGRPLKELVPTFPTKIEAYQYFAASMSQRFATPASRCAGCDRPCEEPPFNFIWRANLHTTKTVFWSFFWSATAILARRLYSQWLVVEFKTVHRFCLECQRRHRSRGIFIAIFEKLLFALLILLLFLTIPLAVFLFAMPFIAQKGEMLKGVIGFLVLSVIGIGLLALVARGFEICRKSLIPDSLRHIGRSPFFLCAKRKLI